MPIDLHIHTTASDGSYTPEEVVERAKALGLTAIAITDHDTMDGVAAALKRGQELGLEVVPGIELNTDYQDIEVHMLGYYLDYTAPAFQAELVHLREARVNRMREMVQKLNAQGVKISYDRVRELAGEGSIGRPHLAKAIIEAGYAKDWDQVFQRMIGRECPAYVPRTKLTPPEAVKLILQFGGVPVLAHPGLNGLDEIILELVRAGLKGIEVYHYDHAEPAIKHYRKIAEKYKLLITGGSDCHGPGVKSGTRLGQVMLPDELLTGLKEAHKLVRVE